MGLNIRNIIDLAAMELDIPITIGRKHSFFQWHWYTYKTDVLKLIREGGGWMIKHQGFKGGHLFISYVIPSIITHYQEYTLKTVPVVLTEEEDADRVWLLGEIWRCPGISRYGMDWKHIRHGLSIIARDYGYSPESEDYVLINKPSRTSLL